MTVEARRRFCRRWQVGLECRVGGIYRPPATVANTWMACGVGQLVFSAMGGADVSWALVARVLVSVSVCACIQRFEQLSFGIGAYVLPSVGICLVELAWAVVVSVFIGRAFVLSVSAS